MPAARRRATPCSGPGRTRARLPTAGSTRFPTDIGTAVNVQPMVFGNTGDRSATGVGFTRNPGNGRERVLRRVPRQRAGRGRRRRHPHAAADRRAREGDAEGLQGAAQDHVAAREDLSRHPGLRVHDRGREALHAADPERQAHRVCVGRHRHGFREGEAASPKDALLLVEPGGPVAAARAGVRSGGVEEAAGRHQRPAGFAWRGVGSGGLHRRPRRRVGAEGQEGAARPEGDRTRRHPRDGSRRGHSHGDGRHDVARRGRRPSDGQALRRRCRRDRRGREAASTFCSRVARP